MPLSFGASQGAAAPAYQTYDPNAQMSSANPYTSLIGAGLGIASQFNPNTPGLAPGAQQQQLPSWMSGQWQNAFNAQNTAASQAQVAGLTPAQLQAMQNIQGAVGYQMPAIQQAQGNASALAGGVGQNQINNFMNPFTQSAVNSTLATMEQQRQQQDANINSQSQLANAWGGDRSAVATNLNDQSAQLAEGNVVSNLENQGYQAAVNSALTNQQAQLAGNQQFSNIIGQNINANTAQNQNLLTIGNQQQQQQQNVLNLPFLRAQAIGQNLNPNVGGQQGYAQNPVTGALAGLQSGLQLGNSLYGLAQGAGGAGFGMNGAMGLANTALGVGMNTGVGGYQANTFDPTYYNQNQNQFVNDANNGLQQFDMPSYTDDYTPPGYFSGAGGQAANLGEMTGTALGSTNNAAVAGFSTAPPLGDPGMADVNNIQAPNFNIQGGSSGLSANQALGGAGNAMNIYQGLQRGGVSGYGSAAINAASLASKTGVLPSAAAQYIGPAGNVLGLYNGLKSGTTGGYINAAGNAMVLGETGAIMGTTGAGIGAASAAAGIAALPAAVAAYGASRPTVQLGSQYYQNYDNNIQAGLKPGASTQQQLLTATMLQNLASYGLDVTSGPGTSTSQHQAVAWNQGLSQLLAPYGVTNPQQASQLAHQILDGIQQMPGQGAGMQSALGGDQGISSQTTPAGRLTKPY